MEHALELGFYMAPICQGTENNLPEWDAMLFMLPEPNPILKKQQPVNVGASGFVWLTVFP